MQKRFKNCQKRPEKGDKRFGRKKIKEYLAFNARAVSKTGAQTLVVVMGIASVTLQGLACAVPGLQNVANDVLKTVIDVDANVIRVNTDSTISTSSVDVELNKTTNISKLSSIFDKPNFNPGRIDS